MLRTTSWSSRRGIHTPTATQGYLQGLLLTQHSSMGADQASELFLSICNPFPSRSVNNADPTLVYFFPQRQYTMQVNTAPCISLQLHSYCLPSGIRYLQTDSKPEND